MFALKKPPAHFVQPKNLESPPKGDPAKPLPERQKFSDTLNTRLNQLFNTYQRNRNTNNNNVCSSLTKPEPNGTKKETANRRVLSAQGKRKQGSHYDKTTASKAAKIIPKSQNKNASLKGKRQSAYLLNGGKKSPQSKATPLPTERGKGATSVQNLRAADSVPNSVETKKQKKEERLQRNKAKRIFETQPYVCKLPKAKYLKAIINTYTAKAFHSSRPNAKSSQKDKSEDNKLSKCKKTNTISVIMSHRLSTSNTVSKLDEGNGWTLKCTLVMLVDSFNGRASKATTLGKKNAPVTMISRMPLQSKAGREFLPPKKLNKVDKSKEALVQWIFDCT